MAELELELKAVALAEVQAGVVAEVEVEAEAEAEAEAEPWAAGARAVRSLKALRLRPGAAAVELSEQNLSDAHGEEVADYIR